MSLKLIFMGTPDFSVPTLEHLVGQGHQLLCVYSQPPQPAGRGLAPRPSLGPAGRQAPGDCGPHPRLAEIRDRA